MEDKQYYEKIFISSGEVPEDRQDVTVGYTNGIETHEVSAEYFSDQGNWYSRLDNKLIKNALYWLKSFSPKEEVVEFLNWVEKSLKDNSMYRSGDEYYYWEKELLKYKKLNLQGLYDIFKQGE